MPIFHSGLIQMLHFPNAYFPAVARRQNRLAYARTTRDTDIWQADGRTVERHPVSSTELDSFPRLSPDGKRIVLASNRSGRQEIWVSSDEGPAPVLLTSLGGTNNDFPDWSPDGRWIVFCHSGDGHTNIWMIDSGGGTPRRLTDRESCMPSFSHDGKWIYFANARAARAEVFRMAFPGGQSVQITRHGGSFPLEAPDGRTLYYLRNQELYEVPAAGGEERSLGLKVIQNDFTVMSDGIYYIAQTHDNRYRGGEIRFYDFARRRERLVQALGDVEFGFGLWKTFLYSAQTGSTNDLMLVENFR